MTYDVIGDGVAPYYFGVQPNTGEITLRNNLRTDKVNFNYVVSISYRLSHHLANLKLTLNREKSAILCGKQSLQIR